MKRTQLGIALLLTALALLAAACSGASPTPAPTSPPAAPTGTVLTSPTATAVPAVDGYDPSRQMFALFSEPFEPPEKTIEAIREIRAAGDRSQVPVMIEISRFLAGPSVDEELTAALDQLTGVRFGAVSGTWSEWMVWLGQNSADFPPPEGYVEWKANLLSFLDPGMGAFVAAGSARIDLTEVVWGGVRTDGIPDLRDPPAVSAAEATYLLPDDRVFGVSINGEHRAYPLRIINAHEMANDSLGGEPIAVAY